MEISVEHQESNTDDSEDTEPIIILNPDQKELGESY